MPEFQPAPGRLPPGRRIYAIGDIHGCAARLAALHRLVAADLAARPVAAPLLLHLGDYVDKGEDSAGVLALLAAGPPLPGVETVNLLGNHEDTLLDALSGNSPGAVADWLWCGGRPTLASYALSPEGDPAGWRAAIPRDHHRFLAGLSLCHREGDYLFVHAGIRPGVAWEQQARDDLLRIRNSFLHSEADHGAVVVHGHTARAAPELRRNRINLDTAAWSGGPLTCGILEADRIGFLEA